MQPWIRGAALICTGAHTLESELGCSRLSFRSGNSP